MTNIVSSWGEKSWLFATITDGERGGESSVVFLAVGGRWWRVQVVTGSNGHSPHPPPAFGTFCCAIRCVSFVGDGVLLCG